MVFRVFADMCNHHNFRTLHHCKKKNPISICYLSLMPASLFPTQHQATTNLLSVSIAFSVLDFHVSLLHSYL